MANSKVQYTADGTTQSFAVTFEYINSDHVSVTVDGSAATFSFNNSSEITISSPTLAGSELVLIKRSTSPTARLVNYVDGSNLSETDLDTDSLQAFYLAQEAIDELDLFDDDTVATTAGHILIADGTDFINKAVSGDATITSSGVVAISGLDATKIANGSVTSTEFQYINTLTSNAQTQIDAIISADISTLDDDNFTLQDNADTSKKAQFQCSGISADTTRTFTFPNASGTLVTNVVEDTTPQLGGFLDANGNYIQMQKGGDISSASPLVIDTDGDYFVVSGTTNFSVMTVAADRHFFLEFAAILTITHAGGTIDIPGAANYTSVAGDVIECVSTAANVVTIVGMELVSGKAQVESVTLSNTATLTSKSLTAPIITGSASAAGTVLFKEDTDNGTNSCTLSGPQATADVTVTLPAATDTLVGKATTDTLTNKTLTAPAVTNLTGTFNSPTGTIGAMTLGGAVTGGDQEVSAVTFKDVAVKTIVLGASGGGTLTANLSLGQHFTATIDTGSSVISVSNAVASDEYMAWVISLTNGGSQTITWTAVDWEGGEAPDLTSSGLDLLGFFTYDGGTTIHGFPISIASA
jgi:hypothetical protein